MDGKDTKFLGKAMKCNGLTMRSEYWLYEYSNIVRIK